jgi:bacterial/archaeal transporter family-2 protein
MVQTILIILFGIAGGMAVGVQTPIISEMGQKVGFTASSFIVYMGGALLSGVLLLFQRGENIRDWPRLPWYMLISGFLGLILYQAINVTLPRVGGTLMITLIIVGELLAGIVIDHFGWLGVPLHPINIPRIAGVVVLMLGAYLISK